MVYTSAEIAAFHEDIIKNEYQGDREAYLKEKDSLLNEISALPTKVYSEAEHKNQEKIIQDIIESEYHGDREAYLKEREIVFAMLAQTPMQFE